MTFIFVPKIGRPATSGSAERSWHERQKEGETIREETLKALAFDQKWTELKGEAASDNYQSVMSALGISPHPESKQASAQLDSDIAVLRHVLRQGDNMRFANREGGAAYQSATKSFRLKDYEASFVWGKIFSSDTLQENEKLIARALMAPLVVELYRKGDLYLFGLSPAEEDAFNRILRAAPPKLGGPSHASNPLVPQSAVTKVLHAGARPVNLLDLKNEISIMDHFLTQNSLWRTGAPKLVTGVEKAAAGIKDGGASFAEWEHYHNAYRLLLIDCVRAVSPTLPDNIGEVATAAEKKHFARIFESQGLISCGILKILGNPRPVEISSALNNELSGDLRRQNVLLRKLLFPANSANMRGDETVLHYNDPEGVLWDLENWSEMSIRNEVAGAKVMRQVVDTLKAQNRLALVSLNASERKELETYLRETL